MIKLVAFDLDGTIGDTIPMCLKALKKTVTPYVTLNDVSENDILETFGLNSGHKILMEEYGWSIHMPNLYPIDEAIGLLNNEIRLVEWRIKYPEQFKSHFNKQPFSPLYLADKTNLIDIMEIISGLFLSKHIVYKNDKPTFLSDLSKVTGA
jgi:hypothetical protein